MSFKKLLCTILFSYYVLLDLLVIQILKIVQE